MERRVTLGFVGLLVCAYQLSQLILLQAIRMQPFLQDLRMATRAEEVPMGQEMMRGFRIPRESVLPPMG